MKPDDDPDEWWASLSSKRKASIRRWIGGRKAEPTPEELGLEPMLDDTLVARQEALPG